MRYIDYAAVTEATMAMEQILRVNASRAVAGGVAQLEELEVVIGPTGVMMKDILHDLGVKEATVVRMALVRRDDAGRIELVQEVLSHTFFTPGVNPSCIGMRHRDAGTFVTLPTEGVFLMVIPQDGR